MYIALCLGCMVEVMLLPQLCFNDTEVDSTLHACFAVSKESLMPWVSSS